MTWTPHVTVATIVVDSPKLADNPKVMDNPEHPAPNSDQDRYLLVYEESEGQMVYNQPAGHLEANESLAEAACRETLEETGYSVELTGVTGVCLYTSPINNVTYHRTTFIAKPLSQDASRTLDDGIEAAVWLTYAEIIERQHQLRSPVVLKVIEDYRQGQRYPLALVSSHR